MASAGNRRVTIPTASERTAPTKNSTITTHRSSKNLQQEWLGTGHERGGRIGQIVRVAAWAKVEAESLRVQRAPLTELEPLG